MPDPEPIRQRVEADADVEELKRFGDETQRLGDQTRRAGDEADRARPSHRGLGATMRNLGGSIRNVVAGWVSLVAVKAVVLGFFREVGQAASNALDQVNRLGEAVRGLAANIGGGLADQVVSDINVIAREQQLSPEQRNQLIESVSALTDVESDLSREQIRGRAESLARLGRATGRFGDQTFQAVQVLGANLGVDFATAADRAAVLFNAGLDETTIIDLVQRAGPVGGERLLALLLAARGEVDLSRAGRSLPTVVGALTRRGDEGQLIDELTSLGITEEMDIVDRLAFLERARASGRITQGQFERAIGGAQNLRLVAPLIRSLPRLPGAVEDLRTGTAEAEIAKLRESELVRSAEREQERRLREQIATEEFGLTDEAEDVREIKTRVKEEGGGSFLLGLARFREIAIKEAAEAVRQSRERGEDANVTIHVGDVNNVAQQTLMNPDGRSRMTEIQTRDEP